MHGDDGFGFVRNGLLDEFFIQIHGVRPDIHKNDNRAPEDKSVSRGGEGIGGHDHLIPGLDVAENGRHVQRGGAGGGEQRLFRAGLFLNPFVAGFGHGSVAANFMGGDRTVDVFLLNAKIGGHVERYA